MKNFLLFFGLITIANSVNAQNIEWERCYGGAALEEPVSIQQTADGGYIVAGFSGSDDGDVHGNHGSEDYWLLKLDNFGDTVWSKCYGGSFYDHARSVKQTADGGYIVAGHSNSDEGDVIGNHGLSDLWIIKLDESGDTVWSKCYGGSNNEIAPSIQQTTDGGYIVASYSESNNGDVTENHGEYDYWVLKLDTFGDTLWSKCYGGASSDYAYSIEQIADGGYIVAGCSHSVDGDVHGSHGYGDSWIVRLNEVGDTLWSKCYGGSLYDIASFIQQTNDGGFIIAGRSNSNDGDVNGNHGGDDYWVLKLNELGNIIWSKCYGGSTTDFATSIQQTISNGFIVAGVSESYDIHCNHGLWDYWILQLNESGDTIWSKCYGGYGFDEAFSILQTTDGGYIVAGYSSSNSGDVSGNHGDEDYWVVKLENVSSVPTQFLPDYVQIYPNPTKGIINIPSEKITKIEVYNLLGELILESHSGKIDISEQSSGIYYIKIFNEKEIATKKIIKN